MIRTALSTQDMDPMFAALTAPEMRELAAKFESSYNKFYTAKASRDILGEQNVLCVMVEAAEYMKFGF